MKRDSTGIWIILSALVIMLSITILNSTKVIENDIILKAWVNTSYILLVLGLLISKELLPLIKMLKRKRPPCGGPGGGTVKSIELEVFDKLIEADEKSLKHLLSNVLLPLFINIFLKRKEFWYKSSTILQVQKMYEKVIYQMNEDEIKKILKDSINERNSSHKHEKLLHH